MRCPYCGGLNPEQADYCRYCGRDLKSAVKPPAQSPPPLQPPYQQGRPVPPAQQGYPPPPARQQPPNSRQHPAPPAQGQPVHPVPAAPPRSREHVVSAPAAASAPEAPGPFPPHTMDQLRTLEQGALPFTVNDTSTNGKRKKIVRIIYPKCVAWQQAATLLKAFKEQQETRFESIVIQGYLSQDPDVYSFTNGQLTFDRDVRLGSQTMNRYQIETGNGFETDSVRIVLTE